MFYKNHKKRTRVLRKENNMKLNEKKLKIETFKQGLLQKDLIKLTGLSVATVSKVYNGGSCNPETALKIAAALNINLEELINE